MFDNEIKENEIMDEEGFTGEDQPNDEIQSSLSDDEAQDPVNGETEASGADLASLIREAQSRKSTRGNLGHTTFARTWLRKVKEEVGPEEFSTLGPGAAYFIIDSLLKKKNPELHAKVQTDVGKTLFRSEVSQIYYKVRDEKKDK